MNIRPDRLFTILGWVVFVLGWIGVIYLMIDTGDDNTIFSVYGGTSQGRVSVALVTGTQVVIAAAILWGVGAFLGTRRQDGDADRKPDQ